MYDVAEFFLCFWYAPVPPLLVPLLLVLLALVLLLLLVMPMPLNIAPDEVGVVELELPDKLARLIDCIWGELPVEWPIPIPLLNTLGETFAVSKVLVELNVEASDVCDMGVVLPFMLLLFIVNGLVLLLLLTLRALDETALFSAATRFVLFSWGVEFMLGFVECVELRR